MIRRQGDTIVVDGPITLANVSDMLREGLAQLRDGNVDIDLAGVTEVDSSAVAMILAWVRAAQSRNEAVRIRNAASGLASLAELYGVDGLLLARD